jgi:hypothetical protein
LFKYIYIYICLYEDWLSPIMDWNVTWQISDLRVRTRNALLILVRVPPRCIVSFLITWHLKLEDSHGNETATIRRCFYSSLIPLLHWTLVHIWPPLYYLYPPISWPVTFWIITCHVPTEKSAIKTVLLYQLLESCALFIGRSSATPLSHELYPYVLIQRLSHNYETICNIDSTVIWVCWTLTHDSLGVIWPPMGQVCYALILWAIVSYRTTRESAIKYNLLNFYARSTDTSLATPGSNMIPVTFWAVTPDMTARESTLQTVLLYYLVKLLCMVHWS